MQLAIIRRRFNPFGGAEKFIIRAIDGLRPYGVRISIIAESWTAPMESGVDYNWIKVAINGKNRIAQFLSFQRAVQHILATRSFDLIQSHERLLGADIYRLGDGVHASWLQRYAQISSWYTRIWLKIDPFHRAIIRTEKMMAQDENLVYVANSPLIKREIIEWYQVAEHRVVLIENGIDTTDFLPTPAEEKVSNKMKLGLNPELPTVIFVGSGFARKGAFQLLEAMKQLTEFQLIVVGHDKKITKIRRYVEKYQLGHRVLIVGGSHEVKSYLAAADIFCLPSLYDSLPNALLEALCCALPVVITSAVGIAETVIENKAGVLCEQEAASIAQALQLAWQQKHVLSQNALNLSKNYDINKMTQLWLVLYKRLINGKKESKIAYSSY